MEARGADLVEERPRLVLEVHVCVPVVPDVRVEVHLALRLLHEVDAHEVQELVEVEDPRRTVVRRALALLDVPEAPKPMRLAPRIPGAPRRLRLAVVGDALGDLVGPGRRHTRALKGSEGAIHARVTMRDGDGLGSLRARCRHQDGIEGLGGLGGRRDGQRDGQREGIGGLGGLGGQRDGLEGQRDGLNERHDGLLVDAREDLHLVAPMRQRRAAHARASAFRGHGEGGA
eukprot:3015316-Heterocapsa_arctica.AAC.1